jgi:hypothetical protein
VKDACQLLLKCRDCGELLPTIAFYRCTSSKTGRQQPCKTCIRKQRDLPGWRERAKARRDAARERAKSLQTPPPSEPVLVDESVGDWLQHRERVAERSGS